MMGTCPDILHLHEWQCAAVSMLYWDVYYNTGFNSARVVLTIHNMDNSGECRQDEFAVTGVPGTSHHFFFGDVEAFRIQVRLPPLLYV